MIVAITGSLFIGLLIGWIVATQKTRQKESDLAATAVQLRSALNEINSIDQRLKDKEREFVSVSMEEASARTRYENECVQSAYHIETTTKLYAEIAEKTSTIMALNRSLAEASANLASARSQLVERDALRAEMKASFGALSLEALEKNRPVFLQLAEQSFTNLRSQALGEFGKTQASIEKIVEPLKKQLETLQQTHTTHLQHYGEVKNQIESLTAESKLLANETQRFREVLKSSQARGKWGEETLRRVVEAAGMSVHCDFIEQVQGEESRPDMVIRIPGERVVIVDAKVPDIDFIADLDTADQLKRKALLQEHVRRLKLMINDLAGRNYSAQTTFGLSLDYVILFLPAESLFSIALEGDKDLIVYAAEKGIILATPASLIAILKSVSLSWQQFAQSENVKEVLEKAKELYSRIVTFYCDHFVNIRAGLERANDSFNKAVGSFEGRVRPCGRELVKMGISAPKEMDEVESTSKILKTPDATPGPLTALDPTVAVSPPSLALKIPAAPKRQNIPGVLQ